MYFAKNLSQIRDNGQTLLEEAEYGDAAKLMDTAMVQKATDGIRSHVEKNSDLRPQAIAAKIVDA